VSAAIAMIAAASQNWSAITPADGPESFPIFSGTFSLYFRMFFQERLGTTLHSRRSSASQYQAN